jgi:PhzF family phenazine biosynthesis protein
MKQISIYHVDAFTSKPFTGNPAGVVPQADGLSDVDMQNIAREMNLPETAFLLPPNHPDADFQVRFFTPANEIDFCGHATIGSSWMMATQYGFAEKSDRLVLQTNIGLVPVVWNKENGRLTAVVMTQVTPRVREADLTAEQTAQLLGLQASDIDTRYPIRLGYTGNWHLLVPVTSRAAIDNSRPDMANLEKLNREQQAVTTHLFTFDTESMDCDVYTRGYGPAVGIPEDPVTGSANGALAGYLVLEGIWDPEKVHQSIFGQGDAMKRPGRLSITITPSSTGPVIQVGGAAIPTISGTLTLAE